MEGKNVLGTKMCVGNIKDVALTKKLSACCILDCVTFYIFMSVKSRTRPNKALSGRPLMTNLDF